MNLSCLLIGPDRILATQLLESFAELGGVQVARDLHTYPSTEDLLRTIRSHSPQAIFLGLSNEGRSFELIRAVQERFPGVQIAAFHGDVDPQMLLKLMHCGIREYIAPPFLLDPLAEMLIRLRDVAMKHTATSASTNLVYSFLPSKPGSGTTTLAINTSLAMSRQPNHPTLLMDLDLNSGLVRFLLKLNNEYTILDAAEHAMDMDDALWPQIVCSVEGLDVIHTSKITPGVRLESAHVRSLIEYARKHYKAICVDLSGNMERYALEVMQESKSIFIVCTPEIPSLHLAREKFQFLTESGLQDKVMFLLNRHSRHDLLPIDQIQSLLGAPVAYHFANDYRGVSQAVAEGRPLQSSSELYRQLQHFGCQLLGVEAAEADPTARRKDLRALGEFLKFGVSRLAPAANSETKG